MTRTRDITRLRTAENISQALKGRISPEVLSDLALSGYAPHYRLGESQEPLFYLGEIKEWVSKDYLTRFHARSLPHIVQVVSGGNDVKDLGSIPTSIRLIPGLMDITAASQLASGIYFMCLDGKVVYVGRSKSVGARLSQHRQDGRKVFDTIFYLPWPAHSIAKIEEELIRALKPEYNTVGVVGNQNSAADALLLSGLYVIPSGAPYPLISNGDNGPELIIGPAGGRRVFSA